MLERQKKEKLKGTPSMQMAAVPAALDEPRPQRSAPPKALWDRLILLPPQWKRKLTVEVPKSLPIILNHTPVTKINTIYEDEQSEATDEWMDALQTPLSAAPPVIWERASTRTSNNIAIGDEPLMEGQTYVPGQVLPLTPRRRTISLEVSQLQRTMGDFGSTLFAPLDVIPITLPSLLPSVTKQVSCVPSVGRTEEQLAATKSGAMMSTFTARSGAAVAITATPSGPGAAATSTLSGAAATGKHPYTSSMATVTTAGESSTDADAGNTDDDDHDVPRRVHITPEPWNDLRDSPRVLSPAMMQQIQQNLPGAAQHLPWERCFCISRDGDSFITFLNCCANYKQTVLVIRTTRGHVLGGFCSQDWKVGSKAMLQSSERRLHRSGSYYGTGQSFLFANHPDTTTPLKNGNDDDDLANYELDPLKELSFFRWTGLNDYCQVCDLEQQWLALGGAGEFGVVLRDGFARGQTGPCATYGNPCLVPPDDGGTFYIQELEVYGLVPLSSAHFFVASSLSSPTSSTAMMAEATAAAAPSKSRWSDRSRLSLW